MQIDGLTIEQRNGIWLVSIEEPPEADETHVDGELVLILDSDVDGDQGDD